MSTVRVVASAFCLVALIGTLASCQSAPPGASEGDLPGEQSSSANADTGGDAGPAQAEDGAAETGAETGGESGGETGRETGRDATTDGSGEGETSGAPPPDLGSQTTAYQVLPSESVTVDIAALDPASEVTCEERPELPVDMSTPPALDGIPAHLRCTWGGETAGDELPPANAAPQLLVIPMAPYMAAYAALGLPAIEQQLALHTMLAMQQPDDPGFVVPMLPPATGLGPSVAVHPRYMHITGGTGMRYVGHDGPPPVQDSTQHGLYYTYQGLTSDGEHWVALFHPVSVGSALESTADELVALEADPEAYFALVAETLAELDPDAGFTPSLSALDSVAESLAIASP